MSGLCACSCVYMCVWCMRGEGVRVWAVEGLDEKAVVGMAWWKYVLGEAWQHGHRASLIPLLSYYL